jgi:hypothetical protein
MLRAIGMLSALTLWVSGCTVTRTLEFGRLSDHRPLVTLIVTEDRSLVDRECLRGKEVPVLGCEFTLPNPEQASGARAVKIVRFTDSLPSKMALEIEAHELCHAVAALQAIPDPCHGDNGGVPQFALPPSRLKLQWP